MAKQKYSIAVLQLNLNNTPENNLEKCKNWVKQAADKGAEVILLPELYSSHYFCQSEDVANFEFAEPRNGVSFQEFSALAKELGIVIIVPFFEKRMSGIYHNSAFIIDTDGSEAGLYRKMHIPDDPHFYEKFYFTPGDIGFKAFETKKGSWARSFVGINGILRLPGSPRCRAQKYCSIPPPLAGTRRRKSSMV